MLLLPLLQLLLVLLLLLLLLLLGFVFAFEKDIEDEIVAVLEKDNEVYRMVEADNQVRIDILKFTQRVLDRMQVLGFNSFIRYTNAFIVYGTLPYTFRVDSKPEGN